MRKTTAQMTCSAFDLLRNRLVRYCGMVMESFATMENLRSRGAWNIQLHAYPMASPTDIHTWPKPAA